MYPQSLRITQPIVFTLHLHEHHLATLLPPQEQIRNPTTSLLVLLRQHLADSCEGLALEAPHDVDKVVQLKGPVDADRAGLSGEFAGVDDVKDAFGFAVGDFYEAVVDFGGSRGVEGVCVKV
jgi:hypothetical protein